VVQRLTFRVLLAVTLLGVGASALFAQGRVVGRFGEANVGPHRAIVHVTVVVPPGLDANAVAEDALRGQGARPFQPAEFALTGLAWNEFLGVNAGPAIAQNYNPAGQPTVAGFTATRIQDARNTWTQVTTSKFAFSGNLPPTTRCPSLVKECPDAQATDGFNDIGWANIKGCCTLAVTWYTTTIDETDMAFNSKFNWTDTTANFNLQTVALHELGHVLGLGHSTATGAIMQATYAGYKVNLSLDDERGVTYLYPEPGSIGNITGTVSASGGGVIPGATVSIADFPASTAASTDGSGTYTLLGIPLGTYSVIASASGYASKTESGTTGTVVNFTLSPSSGGGGGGNCNPNRPNCGN
jgi:Matrixin/Carboxypeptidase regulatory-like domain